MTDKPDDPNDKRPKKTKKSSRPSRYADAPYEIGKGKPPKIHQFRAGGRSPHPQGRTPGSKNRTNFEKLCDKRVKIGEDSLGRAIYKTLGAVIDQQLLQKAANGDLAAIKLCKEIEARLAAQRWRDGQAPEGVIQTEAERAEKEKLRKKLSANMIALLNLQAALKKAGVIAYVDSKLVIPEWVREAASRRA